MKALFSFTVVYVLLLIAGAYGWVCNLLLVFHTLDLPMTGMFIARVVGIFVFPVGAILGYF